MLEFLASQIQCKEFPLLVYQPPKVVIRSPDMPTLCIDNAKYDNLQAIQWSTRCFKTASVSEVGVPQI